MSYSITQYPLSWLDNPSIKLPRFQRKASWDEKKNFKLCISVFKEFPTGVMILNSTADGNYWLLDGRQRRSAFRKMIEDPVNIYEWAMKYIGFKPTSDHAEVSDLFWGKIEEYLQSDKATAMRTVNKKNVYEDGEKNRPEVKDEETEDDEASVYGLEEDLIFEGGMHISSFNTEQQLQSLITLLDLILMVHQKKNNKMSSWEQTFHLIEYFQFLPYYKNSKKSGEKEPINRIELKRFMSDLYKALAEANTKEMISIDKIIDYYLIKYPVNENKRERFINTMKQNEKAICDYIKTVHQADEIFGKAVVGIIKLNQVTELDAQNIFSLVNSGGTQLKAEELLSAKPFWNEVVETDEHVLSHVRQLYRTIELDAPENIVKWDIPATLLSRIDKEHLIFKRYDESKANMNRITLGFKLLSAIHNGGISAKHVASFEKNDMENWKEDVDEIVEDINDIIGALLATSYFKSLISWGKSVDDLLGNAIALEFIAILHKYWIELGRPRNSGQARLVFLRSALALLDRLIFEYSTKVWRGSGDSKLSTDMINYKERIKTVDSEDWLKFVTGAAEGFYNSAKTNVNVLTPVLYHFNAIDHKKPICSVDYEFQVDHIIPQEKLKENSLINLNYIDCLSNLSLLPKIGNTSKSSKLLNQLEPRLREIVSEYTGIDQKDFEKYSTITENSMKSLIEHRKSIFIDTLERRITELSTIG